jgi:hypothetical protein
MPQNQNQAQATPEEQEAYRLLFDQIHAPVFFEKLAEFGIEPQSEGEMNALLKMGADLMRSESAVRQKQASARGSFILQAAQSLDEALADRGLVPTPDAEFDGVIKAAAYRIAQDPAVQRAALTYQEFLARQQAG